MRKIGEKKRQNNTRSVIVFVLRHEYQRHRGRPAASSPREREDEEDEEEEERERGTNEQQRRREKRSPEEGITVTRIGNVLRGFNQGSRASSVGKR